MLVNRMIEKRFSSFLALVCLLFIFLTDCLCSDNLTIPEGTPANISYVVVDLKYSEERGVQICEIQQGLASGYKGHRYACGNEDSITQKFSDKLSAYNKPVWYLNSSFVSPEKKKCFQKNGFIPALNIYHLKNDKVFEAAARRSVKDVADISSYHGVLMGHWKVSQETRESFPGILLMDFPFYPFRRNKMDMNELLTPDCDPNLV